MGFNLADYEPVEERLARFWEENPKGKIFTELVSHSETQYIIKSYLFRDANDTSPWATGYAEETVTTRGVNQTSALENCETSSIGRCLANAGYAPKGKRPEMSPAQQELKNALAKKFKEAGERKTWVESVVFHDIAGISALTEEEVKLCSDQLALEEAKK